MSGERESFIRALQEWALTDEGYARALHEIEQLGTDLANERAEVERLRDGRVRLASKIIDRAADEIVRLRTAGDALAEALDDWPELVAAWNEARNA